MLIRNLQKKGDYQRALLLQEENLALAIANESNIATARKNINYGILPEPTQDQLRSREEVIMDGITELNKVRNQLLTIFKPDQVASFMAGMSEETAQFINVYWTDLKSILETKKRLTKVYFDKIVQQQSKKLERQAGITTERVRLPSDVTTINEVEEIRRLLGPITEPIINIYRRLLAMRNPLSISYWDLRSALPDERELANVGRMVESERQRILQELSQVTRPINPNPQFWTTILDINSNGEFIQAAEDALPVLDMDAVRDVFADINPDFFPMYDRQKEGIAKEINKSETSRQRAERAQSKPAPKPRGRPRRQATIDLVDEEPVTEAQEEATLGYAGFGQPAAIVQQNLPKSLPKSLQAVMRRKKSEAAIPPQGIGPLFQAFTGISSARTDKEKMYGPPTRRDSGIMTPVDLDRQTSDEGIFDERNQAAFSTRPKPVRSGPRQFKGRYEGMGMRKSGRGIAPKPTLYHDFGKFMINGNALDNQLLQVKYQAGGSIPGFSKKVALSDTLQDLLKTLIDTGKLNKSLYKELGDEEKRLLETLMVKAGIGSDYGIKSITPNDDLKKKIDRYEILIGNWNAGNNAVEVLHEIRSLILYFMRIGHISKKDAMSTLMDLQ